MGYPPQNQPPQDPYGQQGQFGQQNPYGQPPQNPYGQPPQNPYGQPQGFPPQNPYGQQPGYPPQGPYGQPFQQPSRGRGCKIAAIIGVLALLVCGIGAYFLGDTVLGEYREVEATLESFMRAGANEDVAAGLDLFTAGATDEDEMTGLFSQREYFEGFKDLSISGFNANSNTTTGTRASVSGSVSYEDGHTATFTSQMVREEDGKWRIENIRLR